ncbi:MAG TPA: DUF3500 domain-containing protein, partial [Thermomicrobiales bacterium]|nr:DUF3500 domain-containing protein [Thermomicrobiales bacterium]
FLATFDETQLAATQLDVDDDIFRQWTNVDGTDRQGIGFRAMNDDQKTAAYALLKASLSAYGYETAGNVMKLNHTQGELTNDFERFDEDLYFFTIYGTPSLTDPWAWRIEGHHLIICSFILGDQLVMTPTFLGSEPAIAPVDTDYAGLSVLQDEQQAGHDFINALSAAQQASAILSSEKTKENLEAGAYSDNATIPYAGIQASTLDATLQKNLLDLIALWVSHMPDDQAAIKMAEVKDHLGDTWFAWIGKTDLDAVFYYRVQSPVILIEFDHQPPGPLGQESDYYNGATGPQRMHIHSIIRSPNGGDYGKDLLAEHYATSSHHTATPVATPESSPVADTGLVLTGAGIAVAAIREILPPRYRNGRAVSNMPMGNPAGLVYDAEGKVAWDCIWEDFCDLALAGGPPHRETMLQAPGHDAVLADMASYLRVVAEIRRGLTMVTGWDARPASSFGWVDLACPDEETAIWMQQAILAENIAVIRHGTTIALPAGPAFTLEKEIRNVITSVAKTHHYWTEHLLAIA